MSSAEHLRKFVSDRLSAAAGEIFEVFIKTIVEYEEEIDRQRRLLHVIWKPEVKLHRIELPQQHVCTREEDLTDQQLCDQERRSSLDEEDPEPPQMKEEKEEDCTSQEGEQLVVKQEETSLMVTPTCETLDFIPDKSQSEAETDFYSRDDVRFPMLQPNSDQQLLTITSHVAESQDQEGGKLDAKPGGKKGRGKRRGPKKSFKCDICGKELDKNSRLEKHMRSHTGEKPFICTICDKSFSSNQVLKRHITTHSDQKPFVCTTCGKGFCMASELRVHIRVHTGEKPYSCTTCGKHFRFSNVLIRHMRIHTGEKPYVCKTCGNAFRSSGGLMVHVKKFHPDEPQPCKTL